MQGQDNVKNYRNKHALALIGDANDANSLNENATVVSKIRVRADVLVNS